MRDGALYVIVAGLGFCAGMFWRVSQDAGSGGCPHAERAELYRLSAENWKAQAADARAQMDAVRRDRPDPAGAETIPPPGVPER